MPVGFQKTSDDRLYFSLLGVKMDRRSVAVLTTGHFFTDFCQGAVPALLPFFIAEHHFSYTAAAGFVFAASITSSILQPLFGHFADHRSVPWIIPVGLLITGVGLAVAGIAPSYKLIWLVIAFSGIGVAAFHPEAARLMKYASGEQRITGMSVFAVGGNGGFAAGPLFTTALIVYFGLRSTLLLVVPAAVIAIVFASQLPQFSKFDRNPDKRRVTIAPTMRHDAWGSFTRLTATVMCRSVIFFGLYTFLPLYWSEVLHQPKAAGGIPLAILLICGAMGTLIGGWLADKYGCRRVVVTGLSVLTPLLLAFVTLGNASAATVLLLPIGLALFAPFSVLVVMGQEYLPNHVGTASGVTLGLAVSVGGLTTPLIGWIADQYGIHAALTVIAFLPMLAAALAFTLPHPQTGVKVT